MNSVYIRAHLLPYMASNSSTCVCVYTKYTHCGYVQCSRHSQFNTRLHTQFLALDPQDLLSELPDSLFHMFRLLQSIHIPWII